MIGAKLRLGAILIDWIQGSRVVTNPTSVVEAVAAGRTSTAAALRNGAFMLRAEGRGGGARKMSGSSRLKTDDAAVLIAEDVWKGSNPLTHGCYTLMNLTGFGSVSLVDAVAVCYQATQTRMIRAVEAPLESSL